jgi:hypothetical protein
MDTGASGDATLTVADRLEILELAAWIACDDLLFRSSRLALHLDDEWWSVP